MMVDELALTASIKELIIPNLKHIAEMHSMEPNIKSVQTWRDSNEYVIKISFFKQPD